MGGYDAWLEAPYVEAAARGDAYEKWCERESLDPDGDHWDAFAEAMDDAREDRAIEAAEARADARREEMEARGVW